MVYPVPPHFGRGRTANLSQRWRTADRQASGRVPVAVSPDEHVGCFGTVGPGTADRIIGPGPVGLGWTDRLLATPPANRNARRKLAAGRNGLRGAERDRFVGGTPGRAGL